MEHGHSQREVATRIAQPGGRGHLRDVTDGALDGAVTTFAIVAGVAGAGLSPFVIIALGLANVLADGFSMAAGNHSGTKAERDDARRLAGVERRAWPMSSARSSPPEGGLYPGADAAYTPAHDASLRHRHSNYRPGALIQDAGTKVLELSHRPDIPPLKLTSQGARPCAPRRRLKRPTTKRR
jgi:hypothetical protein